MLASNVYVEPDTIVAIMVTGGDEDGIYNPETGTYDYPNLARNTAEVFDILTGQHCTLPPIPSNRTVHSQVTVLLILMKMFFDFFYVSSLEMLFVEEN